MKHRAWITAVLLSVLFPLLGSAAEKAWPDIRLRGLNTTALNATPKNSHNPGMPPDRAMFDQMAAWNVNLLHVRIRIDEGSPWWKKKLAELPLIPEDDRLAPYRRNLDGFAEVLRLAEEYNMYVIPYTGDVVGRQAGMPLYESGDERGGYYHTLVDIWTYIAEKHGDNPWLIGYDLLDEPHSDNELAYWISTVFPLLREKIRAVDPSTFLVVHPGPMGRPSSYEDFVPLDDDRIVYCFHHYGPPSYTHQGVRAKRKHLKGKVSYPGEIPRLGGLVSKRLDRDYMERYLEPAFTFKELYGARMLVGGFGVIRWAPGADAWLADAIELFEEHELDWCFHSYGGWNGWNPTFEGDDPVGHTPIGGKTTERLKVLKKGWEKNLPLHSGAVTDE